MALQLPSWNGIGKELPTSRPLCLHLCSGGVEMRPSKFSPTVFNFGNRHGVKVKLSCSVVSNSLQPHGL